MDITVNFLERKFTKKYIMYKLILFVSEIPTQGIYIKGEKRASQNPQTRKIRKHNHRSIL